MKKTRRIVVFLLLSLILSIPVTFALKDRMYDVELGAVGSWFSGALFGSYFTHFQDAFGKNLSVKVNSIELHGSSCSIRCDKEWYEKAGIAIVDAIVKIIGVILLFFYPVLGVAILSGSFYLPFDYGKSGCYTGFATYLGLLNETHILNSSSLGGDGIKCRHRIDRSLPGSGFYANVLRLDIFSRSAYNLDFSYNISISTKRTVKLPLEGEPVPIGKLKNLTIVKKIITSSPVELRNLTFSSPSDSDVLLLFKSDDDDDSEASSSSSRSSSDEDSAPTRAPSSSSTRSTSSTASATPSSASSASGNVISGRATDDEDDDEESEFETSTSDIHAQVFACLDTNRNRVCDGEDAKDCLDNLGDWYKGVCCGAEVDPAVTECSGYNKDILAVCGRNEQDENEWAPLSYEGEIFNFKCPDSHKGQFFSKNDTFLSCKTSAFKSILLEQPVPDPKNIFMLKNHEYRCFGNDIYECGGNNPYASVGKTTGFSFSDLGAFGLDFESTNPFTALNPSKLKAETVLAPFTRTVQSGKAIKLETLDKSGTFDDFMYSYDDAVSFTKGGSWSFSVFVRGEKGSKFGLIINRSGTSQATRSEKFEEFTIPDNKHLVWFEKSITHTFDTNSENPAYAAIYLTASPLNYVLFVDDANLNPGLSPVAKNIQYCTSFGRFSNNLDGTDQDSCELAKKLDGSIANFKWSGTKCCSETDDAEESYNDAFNLSSYVVANSSFIFESGNILLQNKDEFVKLKGPLKVDVRVQAKGVGLREGEFTELGCEKVSEEKIEIPFGEFKEVKNPGQGEPVPLASQCIFRTIYLTLTGASVGGCYNSGFVGHGGLVENGKILNYNGVFYGCNLSTEDPLATKKVSTSGPAVFLLQSPVIVSNTSSNVTSNITIPIVSPTPSTPLPPEFLVSNNPVCTSLAEANLEKKTAVCQPFGLWTFSEFKVNDIVKQINWNLTQASDTGKNIFGCCPDNTCWDGTVCKPVGNVEERTEVKTAYVCTS